MFFLASYISWHYSKAFLNIYGIFLNFLWATYRFFSIPLLFKTFFAPWHHLDSQYGKNLGFENFFGTVIVNTLMRLVGMFIKTGVLGAGIICLFLIFVLEIIFFLIWIALPILIVWLFYTGIMKIVE
jgi:hypothetical protein